MTDLELIRYCYGPDQVLGVLKFDDFALWTVECPWQNNQRFMSCIPDGKYKLAAFDSDSHPKCWQVLDVPRRDGILVHIGNKVEDVTGCIAVGLTRLDMAVYESHDALRLLNDQLDRHEIHDLTIGQGTGATLPPGQPGAQDEEIARLRAIIAEHERATTSDE